MKHLILLPLLLLLSAGTFLQAQNPHPGADYFCMRNHGLYRVIVDTESRVLEEQHIVTGLTVWPDGRFRTLNGQMKRLHEGEFLDANGRVFSDYAALRRDMRAHDLATERIRLELTNGAMVTYHNGDSEPLKEAITLKNGAVVNPNGMMLLPTGQTMQLHEGACVDMAGRMYKDREEFHKKTQAEMKAGLTPAGKKQP